MTEITSLTSGNYGSSSHEAWLDERKKSIGGSDANIIAGNSKYCSWYSLWAEKTGRISKHLSQTMQEAAWLGHAMEPAIATRFEEETEMKVSFREETIRNPLFPYSHANVDGWLEETNEGLEIKTCSAFVEAEIKEAYFEGDIPSKYYAQCLHYMAITEAAGWWLAVCVLQSGFYIFHIERTAEIEEQISILMEDERYFWEEFVLKDIPPNIDGSDATKETVEGMNPDGNGGYIEIPEYSMYLERREEVMAELSQLKEEKNKIESVVKSKMADASTADCGHYRVSWKGKDGKRRFSVKKLSA